MAGAEGSRFVGPHVEYAGFWQRLGAHLLDTVVLLPLFAAVLYLSEQSRIFALAYVVPGMLFGIWFDVYLVKRYGGTPGKRLLKIRIVRTDGDAVGYREAWLRYGVMFAFGMALNYDQAMTTFRMSDAEYLALDFWSRARRVDELAPAWTGVIVTAMNIWIWGEFIVMLTNRKRRALHDFIAGTVVVRDEQSGHPPPVY